MVHDGNLLVSDMLRYLSQTWKMAKMWLSTLSCCLDFIKSLKLKCIEISEVKKVSDFLQSAYEVQNTPCQIVIRYHSDAQILEDKEWWQNKGRASSHESRRQRYWWGGLLIEKTKIGKTIMDQGIYGMAS